MATICKKTKRNPRPLVEGYLEGIQRSVFSDFPSEVTTLAKGRHGVYSLFKGKNLYYVGLASNLRSRIRQHLRDKHQGKWDRFSIYFIKNFAHIKELESLILRIAKPKGNTVSGKLSKAENMRDVLIEGIKAAQVKQLRKVIGSTKASSKSQRSPKRRKKKQSKRGNSLADFFEKGLRIRATYKVRTYYARIRKSGWVRYDGENYTSLSLAGKAVTNRATNGWTFWKFRDKKGNWVSLKELKKN